MTDPLPPDRPSARKLWLQFAQGMLYLGIVAGTLASVTQQSFLRVLAAVVCGSVFTGSLLLAWAVRWAMKKAGDPRQFSLASLIFLTGLTSLYFALVRWLVVHSSDVVLRRQSTTEMFIAVGLMCFIMAIVSIPFLLRMAESAVWLAAWLVRTPAVRRLLRVRRRE